MPADSDGSGLTIIVGAESFQNQFFKALDDYRQNLGRFLLPDSAIVWNGTPIGGRDAFVEMYNQTPTTLHTVTSFDVHPVASPAADGGPQYILNASGKVKIGTERGKNLMGFSSVFFLKQEMGSSPAQVYVSSCSYRLVHRPEDATVLM